MPIRYSPDPLSQLDPRVHAACSTQEYMPPARLISRAASTTHTYYCPWDLTVVAKSPSVARAARQASRVDHEQNTRGGAQLSQLELPVEKLRLYWYN